MVLCHPTGGGGRGDSYGGGEEGDMGTPGLWHIIKLSLGTSNIVIKCSPIAVECRRWGGGVWGKEFALQEKEFALQEKYGYPKLSRLEINSQKLNLVITPHTTTVI